MRRAAAAALGARAGSVIVWHNAWGLPWFAGVDASARRIAYLHYNEAVIKKWIPALRGRVDGIICVNPRAAAAVRTLWPELAPERTVALDQPIAPPPDLAMTRSAREEWVIGCAGRLVQAQKRFDRLVPLVEELRKLGVRYRIEVLGAGPLEPVLRRALGGDARVAFLGLVEKSEYWRRLQTWDAAVFFSEAEGVPAVLLEVLAAGVLPVYPAIGGSLGDDYAPQVDARCLYPPGDLRAAAQALCDLSRLPGPRITELRQEAAALVQGHTHERYHAAFAAFVQRIARAPRVSAEPAGPRPVQLRDWLPLGVVNRLNPEAPWE